ncbi:MaoC/PaaZ C-terminal domain-containing protein [Nocardioides pacificus]
MSGSSAPAPRVVEGEPGGLGVLLKAALPALPIVGQLPGIRKDASSAAEGLTFTRPAVKVAREHADAYAAVCGFPVKDVVPLTYPHLLAFPLHMAIMTEPAFPYPAIGTVHLENSLVSHRRVHVGETLAVTTRVGAPRGHAKGTVIDFLTEVRSADDELVWESTSTYLRRGKGDPSAAAGLSLEDVPPTGTRWRLPGDLGRRYAAVSGDHNPIHLYPLTARALGFPRQIAHGMWSKARCVAALENRLPDAVRVEVAFKKPILLPGTVAFGSRPTDDGYAFSLSNPKNGAPHLVGRTAPA